MADSTILESTRAFMYMYMKNHLPSFWIHFKGETSEIPISYDYDYIMLA